MNDIEKIFEVGDFWLAYIKLQQGRRLSDKEEAIFYKYLFNRQCEREKEAYRIYRTGEGSTNERLRAAARYLGWTKKGEKTPRYDSAKIFWDYLDLTMGTYDLETLKPVGPVSREKAIAILVEKHGFPTPEACFKCLSRYISEQRKKGVHIPRILPHTDK